MLCTVVLESGSVYFLLEPLDPGVFGRFDLAALVQPHLKFLFVCLFDLLVVAPGFPFKLTFKVENSLEGYPYPSWLPPWCL